MEYAEAYAALAEALTVRQNAPEPPENAKEAEKVKTIMDSVIITKAPKGAVREKRFISAVSCRGILHLNETVNLLCKQKYKVGRAKLVLAARLAAERGAYTIECPEPLDPEKLEAVLLLDCGAGFLLAGRETDDLPFRERMDFAIARLKTAKALHDELESLYRPYMDFPALTEYTESCIRKLFSNEKTFSCGGGRRSF